MGEYDVKSSSLMEELVHLMYIECPASVHIKIIKFIRYYFKSYISNNFEFFTRILEEVSSLQLNTDLTGVEFP